MNEAPFTLFDFKSVILYRNSSGKDNCEKECNEKRNDPHDRPELNTRMFFAAALHAFLQTL